MKTREAVILGAVLSAALIMGAYHVGVTSGRRAQARHDAIVAHHEEVDHCLELGEEVTARLFLATRGRKLSMQEFEKDFGKITALDPSATCPSSAKHATHMWTHPGSHQTFFLSFKDGVLWDMGSEYGSREAASSLPSIEERMRELM